jgi:hypothetical protein
MKNISKISLLLALVALFAFVGCKKQEAKPVEEATQFENTDTTMNETTGTETAANTEVNASTEAAAVATTTATAEATASTATI